jgi:[calcium/calmodulin-dependent protein kinase] kinase
MNATDAEGFSGRAADIWGMGITLYALVYRKLPFWGETIASLMDSIENAPIPFLESRNISEGLTDLLTRILDKNPETRIKMPEILLHPWMNEGLDGPLQKTLTMDIPVSEQDIE